MLIAPIQPLYPSHNRQPYRKNGMLVICAWCKKTKIGKYSWELLQPTKEENITHTICPTCFLKTKRSDPDVALEV
jgi:hypothetical protein